MPANYPPISVLLPVRDGQATLAAALHDLIRGLGPDDEIVVVDDGSEDATPSLLARFGQSERRLRVVRTRGLGLVPALNLGLSEVSHRWVARADSDDRYPSDRLSHQRLQARAGVVLIAGDYRMVVADRPVGDLPCALTSPFVAASMIHPQRIPHPGVLFDSEAVLSVGGYRAQDFPAEDLALWMRLAYTGTFVGVPAVTVRWMMTAGSISHSQQQSQRLTTSNLLRYSFPDRIFSNLTPDDVQRELNAYSGTRLERVRRLLLARDLRALAERGLSIPAYREVRGALLRDPWGTLQALRQMTLEKVRRDHFRRSIAEVGN